MLIRTTWAPLPPAFIRFFGVAILAILLELFRKSLGSPDFERPRATPPKAWWWQGVWSCPFETGVTTSGLKRAGHRTDIASESLIIANSAASRRRVWNIPISRARVITAPAFKGGRAGPKALEFDHSKCSKKADHQRFCSHRPRVADSRAVR